MTSITIFATLVLVSSIVELAILSQPEFWNFRERFPELNDLSFPRFTNFATALGILYAISTFLASFAMVYWKAAKDSPSCFSAPLTKLDAAYFAVTTFTTTGFGDIYPMSQNCRMLVTIQMGLGVLILSVVVAMAVGRVIAGRRA